MLENQTPRLQTTLLDEQSNSQQQQEPSLDQSLPTTSSASQAWLASSTRSNLETHITKLGYNTSADVEAIYRGIDAIEMFDSPKCCPASHNFRWTWQANQDISPTHLSACLRKYLQNHAALRIMIVPLENETSYPSAPHMVLRASEQWLDALMEVVQPVENAESLRAFARDPALPSAESGGPCFLAQIVPISGSDRPGLVMTVNHAVFDAVSIDRFLDDLEEFLAGNGAESGSVIPYSVFADMYHLHKSSVEGQISKAYQMNKFKQLDSIEPCLWPRARGAGFMIGDEGDWKHQDGTPGTLAE